MPFAVLDTDPRTQTDRIGFLRFQAPDGRIDVIMVTDGPSFEKYPEREVYHRCPVWHIEFIGAQVQVEPAVLSRGQFMVTPSIDIKDRYHTGYQTVFDVVDELPPQSDGWDKRMT